MEVQQRLQEQLEVQRHLQLRIEAQGKYLQSILEKAKETLADHTSASPVLKAAHEELTELATKVIICGEPAAQGQLPSFDSLNLPGLNPPELLLHNNNNNNNHHHHPVVDVVSQGVSAMAAHNSNMQQLQQISSVQKNYLTNLSPHPIAEQHNVNGAGGEFTGTSKRL